MAENAKNEPGDLEAIALIIIAILGRFLLEPFPSVEPIIPIAVYASLRYAGSTGILVGMISYPLSNFFLLGGPFGLWSLQQAVAGGLAGGIAQYGRELTTGNLILYSVIGTLIFEFILNLGSGALLYWPFSIVHIASNILIAILIGAYAASEKK